MSTAKNAGTLRVVLDTNILISAFTYPNGRLSQIWRLALLGKYHLLVSPAIIGEVGKVLRAKFGWDGDHVTARLRLLIKVAEIVIPVEPLQTIEDDPDDNRILECAVAGQAHLIVSGDRHIRRIGSYREIGIASPTEFLRILGEAMGGAAI